MQHAFLRRTALFLTAAALSAVVSDWAIEGSASLGIYGPAFVEHDRRSIVCTATAAAILAVFFALVRSLRYVRQARGVAIERDWLADAARDLASKPWSVWTLAKSFVAALVVRYAMEAVGNYQVSGNIALGNDWLGGPVAIALLFHLCFCVATYFGLVALMTALDRTMRHVVRIAIAFIVALERGQKRSFAFALHDRKQILSWRSLFARHRGERAPPDRVHVVLASR